MYLKQIKTKNIQNHAEVVVDLPATGLVVLTGHNSNGKSVIGKATKAAITGSLRKPRKRASLVNRKALFGEISYVRNDDVILTIHISREASQTFVKYEVPGEEPIIRYIADKNYTELVYRFGWHYDAETGISLNLAEDDEAMLFYKTTPRVNCSVLETATLDAAANKAEESIDATLSEARSLRDQFANQANTYIAASNELVIEDTEPLQKLREKLDRCRRNLSAVYIPVIPDIKAVPRVRFTEIYKPRILDIKAVPNVRFTEVYKPLIPMVKYPRIVNVSCVLPDIVGVASELHELRNHRCPTCGRGFDCEC